MVDIAVVAPLSRSLAVVRALAIGLAVGAAGLAGCGAAPPRCAPPPLATELALGGAALGHVHASAIAVLATARADQLAALTVDVAALGLDAGAVVAPRFAGHAWPLAELAAIGLDPRGPAGVVVLDLEAGSVARFARVADLDRLTRAIAEAAGPDAATTRAGDIRIVAAGADAFLVRDDVAWFVTSGAASRRDRHALRLATVTGDEALAADPGFRELGSRADGEIAVFVAADRIVGGLAEAMDEAADAAAAIAARTDDDLAAGRARGAGAAALAELGAVATHQRRAATQVSRRADGWRGVAALIEGLGPVALGITAGGGQLTVDGAARPAAGSLAERLLVGGGGQRADVAVRTLEAARIAPVRVVTAAAPDDVAAIVGMLVDLTGGDRDALGAITPRLAGPLALAAGDGVAVRVGTSGPVAVTSTGADGLAAAVVDGGVVLATSTSMAGAAADVAAAIPATRVAAGLPGRDTCSAAPGSAGSAGAADVADLADVDGADEPDGVGLPTTVVGFVVPGTLLPGASWPAATAVALPPVPTDDNADVPTSREYVAAAAGLGDLAGAIATAEAGVAGARAALDREVAAGLGTATITVHPGDGVIVLRARWRTPGASLGDAVAAARTRAAPARADLDDAIARRDGLVAQYHERIGALIRLRARDVAAWDRDQRPR